MSVKLSAWDFLLFRCVHYYIMKNNKKGLFWKKIYFLMLSIILFVFLLYQINCKKKSKFSTGEIHFVPTFMPSRNHHHSLILIVSH